MTKMNVLVTGGSGFIGSHLVRELLGLGHNVCNLDSLTYAAVNNSRMAAGWQHKGYQHKHVDCSFLPAVSAVFKEFKPNIVFHLAAETHVDRSIDDADQFLRTNINGTKILLDMTRQYVQTELLGGKPAFVYVSTDEVYGPVPDDGWVDGVQVKPDGFHEHHRLNPRNPYSATKAAAEHLVMSYFYTYGLPAVITRGCNTYGSYQVPEKFLPMMIRRAAQDEPLPIYGDGGQTREWMHVTDHVKGIVAAGAFGKPGEAFNLGSGTNECNLHVALEILHRLGKPESQIEHVDDRPGHDRDYAIFSEKADALLGWEPTRVFIEAVKQPVAPNDGLNEMINWYTGPGTEWCELAGASHLQRKGLGRDDRKKERDAD